MEEGHSKESWWMGREALGILEHVRLGPTYEYVRSPP